MATTIRDIAEYCKVSTGTVSGVINERDHIRPEVRRKVLAAIRELKYNPLKNNRGIQTAIRKSVGLVLPQETSLDPFYARAVISAKHHVKAMDCNYMLFTEDEIDAITRDDVFPGKKNLHCDGLIFFCPPDGSEAHISTLQSWGVPCAVIKRDVKMDSVAVVLDDQAAGTALALEHLYALGHRRIAFSAWFGTGRTVIADAYRAFMKEKRLMMRPAWYNVGDDPDITSYTQWLQRLFLATDERPTAIVCDTDENAHCAVQYLGQMGLRVPHDVAVTGQNDDDTARMAPPGITTVTVPIEKMVETACSRIRRAVRTGDMPAYSVTRVAPELVVRGSTDASITSSQWRWKNAADARV